MDIPGGQEYFASTQAQGIEVGALNGCTAWQDYIVQTNLKQESGSTWTIGDYMGTILRHTDSNNYYWVILQKLNGSGAIELRIIKTVLGATSLVPGATATLATIPEGIGSGDAPAAFADDTPYTLKAQILGDDIRVKLWKPVDSTDPNASEPVNWVLGGTTPITDTSLPNGNFGVRARDDIFQFDDVTVLNPVPIT